MTKQDLIDIASKTDLILPSQLGQGGLLNLLDVSSESLYEIEKLLRLVGTLGVEKEAKLIINQYIPEIEKGKLNFGPFYSQKLKEIIYDEMTAQVFEYMESKSDSVSGLAVLVRQLDPSSTMIDDLIKKPLRLDGAIVRLGKDFFPLLQEVISVEASN